MISRYLYIFLVVFINTIVPWLTTMNIIYVSVLVACWIGSSGKYRSLIAFFFLLPLIPLIHLIPYIVSFTYSFIPFIHPSCYPCNSMQFHPIPSILPFNSSTITSIHSSIPFYSSIHLSIPSIQSIELSHPLIYLPFILSHSSISLSIHPSIYSPILNFLFFLQIFRLILLLGLFLQTW